MKVIDIIPRLRTAYTMPNALALLVITSMSFLAACGSDSGDSEPMVFYVVDTLSIDPAADKIPLREAVSEAEELAGFSIELPSEPMDGFEPEAVLVDKQIPGTASRTIRVHYVKDARTAGADRITFQMVNGRSVAIDGAEVAVAEPRGIDVMFGTTDSGSITFEAEGVGYILVDVDPATPREDILAMIGSLAAVES